MMSLLNHHFSRTFQLVILAACLFSFAPLRAGSNNCGCFWSTHIGAEGRGGNFREGGGIDLWSPIYQNGHSITFIQGGGGYFQSLSTGNIGVGQRAIINPWLGMGANVFGDIGISNRRKVFGQIGVGLELFGCHWLARTNGYIPIVKAHAKNIDTINSFVDTFFITTRNFVKEESYGGFDIEAGYELGLWSGHLWGYGGYFYRDRKGHQPIQGPRLRAEYRLDCGYPFPRWEWIASVDYEYDRIHGHTVSGYGGIRYYIGRCPPPTCCDSPLCRYMGKQVWRDKAIWVEDDRRVSENLVNQLIFVDNLTDGIGTQTDPATLPNGLAMLQTGGVLFFLQDTGDIPALAVIDPPNNTQLLGFGNNPSRLVVFPDGATVNITDLTASGRAIVDASALGDVVLASNNLFISGWEIDNGSPTIRQSLGVGPVLISDMILRGFGAFASTGIQANGGKALTILDSMILDWTSGALNINAPNGPVLVSNSTLTAPGFSGVTLTYDGLGQGAKGSLRITQSSIINFLSPAVLVLNKGIVRIDSSSTVSSVASPGLIVLVDEDSDIRVFDSTFTSPAAGSVGGIDLTFGPNSDQTYVFVVERSIFNSTLDSGIQGTLSLGPNETVDFRIVDNLFLTAMEGISLAGPSVQRAITGNASFNSFIGPPTAARFVFPGPNLTFNRNIAVSGNYLFEGSPGTAITSCVTIQNNFVTPITASDIVLDNIQGVDGYSVFDFSGGAAGLSTNNFGIGVSVIGGAPSAAPAPCPLPVIPPNPII